MAREPPPWRSLFFLLPVPLQVIRSRDSFTPRTTGIQLLSAVVLEESISSCRKQFDIQHKRKNSLRSTTTVEEALEVPAPQQASLYLKRYRRSYKTTSGVVVGTIIVVIEKEEPSRSGPYSRIYSRYKVKIRWSGRKRGSTHKEVRHNPLSSFEEILLETIKGQGFCEETILTKLKYQ